MDINILISDADSGEAFDPGVEYQRIQRSENTGAVAVFVGHVRASEILAAASDDENEQEAENGQGDEKVALTALTIEHYPGMTEAVIQGICEQAARRWPLQSCRVLHRVGTLRVGDPIVMVATASGHRASAFDACEFIMDFLKTEAPFWKKAVYDNGELWIDARQSDVDRKASWQ